MGVREARIVGNWRFALGQVPPGLCIIDIDATALLCAAPARAAPARLKETSMSESAA